MKVVIDADKCIGCGACVALALKSFKLTEDYKAVLIQPPKDDKEIIKEAAESCPVEAIEVS